MIFFPSKSRISCKLTPHIATWHIALFLIESHTTSKLRHCLKKCLINISKTGICRYWLDAMIVIYFKTVNFSIPYISFGCGLCVRWGTKQDYTLQSFDIKIWLRGLSFFHVIYKSYICLWLWLKGILVFILNSRRTKSWMVEFGSNLTRPSQV